MANEVKLNCYTLQIRERHTRNQRAEYLSLKDVNFNTGDTIQALDFGVFFRNFIEHFDNEFMGISGDSAAIYLPPGDIRFASERRILYGFMKAGRTGTGRTIVERDNPDEEVFRVTPDHVDSIDYFFLVWFPEDSNTGLIIIQGLSTESASDVFRRLFHRYFSNKVEGQVIEISRYIPKDTIQKMKEDGDIDKITLTKQRLPPDRANRILGTNFIQTDVSIEIKIKGLKNHSQQLKDLMSGNWRNLVNDAFLGEPVFFTTPVLEDVGMDGSHDVSFEYEFNGKKATAKQSKGFQLAPFYYVDENSIERDPTTNLPTRVSIQSYCLDFFGMIVSEMQSNQNNVQDQR